MQVKVLTKQNLVLLGNSLDKIMGDYWLIINNVGKEPNAYVMKPEEIRSLAHRGKKNGIVSYWLQSTSYDTPEFREAWHSTGNGNNMA